MEYPESMQEFMEVTGIALLGAVVIDVQVRDDPDLATAVVPAAREGIVLAVPEALVGAVVEQVDGRPVRRARLAGSSAGPRSRQRAGYGPARPRLRR
mgnify:CR=1 FL=1